VLKLLSILRRGVAERIDLIREGLFLCVHRIFFDLHGEQAKPGVGGGLAEASGILLWTQRIFFFRHGEQALPGVGGGSFAMTVVSLK
jgi:hypothetical protein